MKITLWPKSGLGKWSASLSLAFIVLMWLKIQFSIPVMSFAIVALGLLGFIFALISIFKNREKSVPVYLSVLVGIVIILWIAAELIYPH